MAQGNGQNGTSHHRLRARLFTHAQAKPIRRETCELLFSVAERYGRDTGKPEAAAREVIDASRRWSHAHEEMWDRGGYDVDDWKEPVTTPPPDPIVVEPVVVEGSGPIATTSLPPPKNGLKQATTEVEPVAMGRIFQADDKRVLHMLDTLDQFVGMYPESAYQRGDVPSAMLNDVRNYVRFFQDRRARLAEAEVHKEESSNLVA